MDGQTASDPAHPDQSTGPFTRPLFDDPDARRLSRVGVVDVGSNSVRLVVFDGAARSPAYFYNEKILCGLGAGLRDTGVLNPSGRERALRALKRFKLVADQMGINPLTAVATAAVREATDGPDFVDAVRKTTGIELFVIDGGEEARLSAQGVLLGWPEAQGVVSDIGGSSMELALLTGGAVGDRMTSPLAPQVLAGVEGGAKARQKFIRQHIAALTKALDARRKPLFLVGGSWRAIARIDMVRRNYPLSVQHEYRMTAETIDATLGDVADEDAEVLASRAGVGQSRMALVPLASEVLGPLIDALEPTEIAISAYGIREGLLFEQMPSRLRTRDPLIEAARFAEAKDARIPGFGKTLFGFVRPLFADSTPERLRLVQAACHLHDVNWRAHPDYRAEVCFESATRADLGGLTHEDRVFLGLALLHRYKNSRAKSSYTKMFDLISDADKRTAEILGKAMRLGAMFSVATGNMDEALNWHAERRHLDIRIPEASEALFGEVAQARFRSLVDALGATGAMRLSRK